MSLASLCTNSGIRQCLSTSRNFHSFLQPSKIHTFLISNNVISFASLPLYNFINSIMISDFKIFVQFFASVKNVANPLLITNIFINVAKLPFYNDSKIKQFYEVCEFFYNLRSFGKSLLITNHVPYYR